MLTAAEIEEWEMDERQEWLMTVRSLEADRMEWQERAVKAEQQRDELLRALKAVNQRFVDADLPGHELAVMARAAIAKIEGENNAKG